MQNVLGSITHSRQTCRAVCGVRAIITIVSIVTSQLPVLPHSAVHDGPHFSFAFSYKSCGGSSMEAAAEGLC